MDKEVQLEMDNQQIDGSERKKGRVQYNLRYPVPDVRSSLDRDIKILKAFVTASDQGQKLIGSKDVAPFVGCNPQIVGGVLAFFSKIGLASKEGVEYKPMQETVDVVKEMKFETDEKAAGKFLIPMIIKTWFGDMTIKIFNADREPLSKEELFKRLGKMSGADPEYHKSAINRIIEYLEYSHLIEYNEDKKAYSLKEGVNQIPIEEKVTKPPIATESITTESKPNTVTFQKPPTLQNNSHESKIIQKPRININLNIDNDIDEQKFRQLVKILKEELVDNE